METIAVVVLAIVLVDALISVVRVLVCVIMNVGRLVELRAVKSVRDYVIHVHHALEHVTLHVRVHVIRNAPINAEVPVPGVVKLDVILHVLDSALDVLDALAAV